MTGRLRPGTFPIGARRCRFRTSYIDFDRGIRVGRLEVDERITQILKARLSERFAQRMICDRWGRGVFWQWICWVPEPNKRAKPHAEAGNFSSAKFFVAVDRAERIFQAGMQIERAPVRPDPDDWPLSLGEDWDWHVMLKALRAKELPRRLRRLLREGFILRAGPFESLREFRGSDFSLASLKRTLGRFPKNAWGGLQLYWGFPEQDLRAMSGQECIDAVMAVFEEVAPVMDLCMYAPCLLKGRR